MTWTTRISLLGSGYDALSSVLSALSRNRFGRSQVRTLIIIGLSVGVMGCSTEPPEPQMLVDHEQWVEVGVDDDPFNDRPQDFECSPLAFGYEFIGEHSFEVETNNCDYVTVSQTTLAAVEEGDELTFRLWHNALVGADGESHVAVWLGGQVVWDVRIPIPGEAELVMQTLFSEVDAPAGSVAFFHLHNHGSNTYNFIDFSVTDL